MPAACADTEVRDFETVRVVTMSGGGMAAFNRVSFNNNTLVPSLRGSGLVMATVTDGQGASQVCSHVALRVPLIQATAWCILGLQPL